MPNFKSVVLFPLVDFGEGYLLVVVTGGKQSQLLVLTDLDCIVRLDWSLTIKRCCKGGKCNSVNGMLFFYIRFLSFRGRLIKGWVGMLKKNCEVQKSLEGEGVRNIWLGGGGLKKIGRIKKVLLRGAIKI